MQIDLSTVFQLFSVEESCIGCDTVDECAPSKTIVEQAKIAQVEGREYTIAFIQDVEGHDCLADAQALAQFFDVEGFVAPQTKVACAKVHLFVLRNQEQIFRPLTETPITRWPPSATMRKRLFSPSPQLQNWSFAKASVVVPAQFSEPVQVETPVQIQEDVALQQRQVTPQTEPISEKEEVLRCIQQLKTQSNPRLSQNFDFEKNSRFRTPIQILKNRLLPRVCRISQKTGQVVRIAKSAVELGMFEEAEKIIASVKHKTSELLDLACYIKGIMPVECHCGPFATITRGWCYLSRGQIEKAAKCANTSKVRKSSELLVRWFRMIYAGKAKKKDEFKAEEKAFFKSLSKEKITYHARACVDIYINLHLNDDLFDVIAVFLENFSDDVTCCNEFLKKIEGKSQYERTAENLAKHILTKEPANPLANYLFAEIKRAAQGNKDEIKAHYTFATQCEDKEKAQIAKNELTILAFREAKTEEQLLQIASQMEKMHKQNPTSQRVVALYGEWLIRSKKIEETVALLKELETQSTMKQVSEHIAKTLQETYPEEPLSYQWVSRTLKASLEQNLQIARKAHQFFQTLQNKITLTSLLLVTKTDQNSKEAERLLEEIVVSLDTFQVKDDKDEQVLFELLALANYCKNSASQLAAYAARIYEHIEKQPNLFDYCTPLATKLMREATVESWNKVKILLEPLEKKERLRDRKGLRQLYALAILSLYGLERYEEVQDVIPTVLSNGHAKAIVERLLFRMVQLRKIEKGTKQFYVEEIPGIQKSLQKLKSTHDVWARFIDRMLHDGNELQLREKTALKKPSIEAPVPTEVPASQAIDPAAASALSSARGALNEITLEQAATVSALMSLATRA